MTLRIAIVIEHYDPAGGGAERSTQQIAEELIRRGHAVTVLAASAAVEPVDASAEASTGPRVVAMAGRRSASVLRLWRFCHWADAQLRQGDFDVSLSITNAVAADIMQPRGGTVRETLRRNIARRSNAASRLLKRLAIALQPKQHLLLHLERRNLRSDRVRRIVAVSDYVVRQLQEHYRIDREKVIVIHNAAVMPALDPAQHAALRQTMRDKLDLDDRMVGFAFIAMNPQLKGIETLWRAMRRLVRQLREAPGLAVGRMPVLLLVGNFGVDTQRHADALNLKEHVRIVGRHDRVQDIYAAADVTVLPTFYDPSSKVVLESLMMAVPAISTRCNGASDFIGESRGRVIDAAEDDHALAEAMRQLMDPNEHARCQAACAGLAETLSMARHVDQLEAVLKSCSAATR